MVFIVNDCLPSSKEHAVIQREELKKAQLSCSAMRATKDEQKMCDILKCSMILWHYC